ncbi:MAG: hypothetical protein M1423_01060 [Acidobacteria bacterium]|nr:hypothetical protein [Acidobacteriota bacterium]
MKTLVVTDLTQFMKEEFLMRRINFHAFLLTALASLLVLTSSPVSAQMMGGMMGGKSQGQGHSMQMGENMQSMRSMMQQMQGMMAEMQGMMRQNKDMMSHRGMSGMSGHYASGAHWPSMMQSMDSMGQSMQQMLAEMDAAMANRSMMANPSFNSNMHAMQTHMRSMMDSMQEMLHNMREIKKAQPTLKSSN